MQIYTNIVVISEMFGGHRQGRAYVQMIAVVYIYIYLFICIYIYGAYKRYEIWQHLNIYICIPARCFNSNVLYIQVYRILRTVTVQSRGQLFCNSRTVTL
jgi:hypothetical protein